MRWALLACMLLALGVNPGIVRAQLSGLTTLGNNPSPTRNEPVTFAADQVEYDRENALVIARGHVEAWQNDHVLRADEITFDRNTGTAAAKGNVVLLEPDGEVMFADYAEMTQNMREGVLKDMRALLAQNGKLAANGARRTAGELNELSRVVYSACDLCKDNPSRAPLWQIRAFSAVQDLEHKRIEYEDAVLQMYGVPVAYFPYLSAPDPSVKRASGLLMPLVGTSSHLGAFIGIPYFWAINGESDATFTPILTSRAGPQLAGEYRHRFNSGFVTLNGSAGYLNGSPQGYMDAKGQFSYNDTWRMGFDVNRVSSNDYVRAIHIGDIYQGQPNVLVSQLYAEGFGQGAYSRLDSRFYQGLLGNVATSTLPLVLPRYTYSYFGTPDRWGGRLSLEANAFNVYRTAGTRTQRGALTVNWERPFEGAVGDLWKITLHTDA
ncbi:MAG: LPS-assembly protein LptD, partial [Acetobacteraceae bacterium]|nr:LPS-assembly protein LptD [Acetobacteraceae bacterium]